MKSDDPKKAEKKTVVGIISSARYLLKSVVISKRHQHDYSCKNLVLFDVKIVGIASRSFPLDNNFWVESFDFVSVPESP